MTTPEQGSQPLPFFVRAGNLGHESADPLAAMIARGLVTHENIDRRGRLYASDSAHCPRQAVLNSTAERSGTNGAAMNAYMALGNSIEDIVLGSLDSQRALLFSQYRLPDMELNMGGKVDAIALVDGKIRVLEIKSCGELPDVPRPYQAAQALMYGAILGLRSTLLYFSRQVASFDGKLKIVSFDLDPTEGERNVYFACYAQAALRMGVLPDVPYHITGQKDCGFCGWKRVCWHGDPPPPSAAVRPVSADDHVTLVEQATAMTRRLLDPVEVLTRRNKMLTFIEKHSKFAGADVLRGTDWTPLI